MLIITTMPDASEIISYDTAGIPLYINNTNLSNYPDRRVFAHWHEDIELIRIVKGCMYYRVNGKRVLLQENDCILVNGKQMHYGYSATQEDCNFTCVLFHPSLLTGNQMLYEKYISPVLANEQLEYLHFQAENPFHSQLTEAIDHIIALKTDNQPLNGFPPLTYRFAGKQSCGRGQDQFLHSGRWRFPPYKNVQTSAANPEKKIPVHCLR